MKAKYPMNAPVAIGVLFFSISRLVKISKTDKIKTIRTVPIINPIKNLKAVLFSHTNPISLKDFFSFFKNSQVVNRADAVPAIP